MGMMKLIRQKMWNYKTICHNYDRICEVDGYGELIDDYPFYTYLGSYKAEWLNFSTWTNSKYRVINKTYKIRIDEMEEIKYQLNSD